MSDSSTKQSLQLGHVMLDTCFITKAFQYSDTPYFDNLFALLRKNMCTPVISQLIEYEFLCGCKTKEQLKVKKNWINSLSGFILPTTKEIIDNARIISNIYSNKNINSNQINFIDISNSAFLKKHKDLFLITLDKLDYPTLIHDRIKVLAIDVEKEILTLAFYKFNEEKFDSLKNIIE